MNTIMKFMYPDSSNFVELQKYSQENLCKDTVSKSVVIENAICIPSPKGFDLFSGGVFKSTGEPVELSFQRKGIECADVVF